MKSQHKLLLLGEKVAEGRMRGKKLHSPHPNPLPEEREQQDAITYCATGLYCDSTRTLQTPTRHEPEGDLPTRSDETNPETGPLWNIVFALRFLC